MSSDTTIKSLDSNQRKDFFVEEPYFAYSYGYPHKSSYGPLTPTVDLQTEWEKEKRDSLQFYVHLPFCEMRCGFCNLLAQTVNSDDLVDLYLDSIERQARVVSEYQATYAKGAFGGGTPTVLSPAQLQRLFEILTRYLAVDFVTTLTSVETSPKTATTDRLAILREHHVRRISIGVQSFVEEETQALGRPQSVDQVRTSLELVRSFGFPELNIDLIYGHESQTPESWLSSIEQALEFDPTELFLYPLYVRPETGLDLVGTASTPQTHARFLYRVAREALLERGYSQLSLRCFRKGLMPQTCGDEFSCQTDGMVGLGAGARSYTSQLHYSSRFAVSRRLVKKIVDDWSHRSESEFRIADWGVRLTEDDRRRRFIIQSLLHRDGLDENQFQVLFGMSAVAAIPVLSQLENAGLTIRDSNRTRLSSLGFEWSDAIGPLLYSMTNLTALQRFSER